MKKKEVVEENEEEEEGIRKFCYTTYTTDKQIQDEVKTENPSSAPRRRALWAWGGWFNF